VGMVRLRRLVCSSGRVAA